jgi:ribosomal protein S18 acetylase RimI-like enzyme
MLNPDHFMRWMIRTDMPAVLAIDESTPRPWGETEFLRQLRRRNVIGMVVNSVPDDVVVGFVVYELNKDSIEGLRLAVAPEHRRRGFGTVLLNRLLSRMGGGGGRHRERLILDVPEECLSMHLFLKAHGIRAVGVINDPVEGDHYRFRTELQEHITEGVAS